MGEVSLQFSYQTCIVYHFSSLKSIRGCMYHSYFFQQEGSTVDRAPLGQTESQKDLSSNSVLDTYLCEHEQFTIPGWVCRKNKIISIKYCAKIKTLCKSQLLSLLLDYKLLIVYPPWVFVTLLCPDSPHTHLLVLSLVCQIQLPIFLPTPLSRFSLYIPSSCLHQLSQAEL